MYVSSQSFAWSVSVDQSVEKSVAQSVSQLVGRSASRFVIQVVGWTASRLISPSVCPSINQSVSRSVNSTVGRSVTGQLVGQSVGQSVSQSPVSWSVSLSVGRSVSRSIDHYGKVVVSIPRSIGCFLATAVFFFLSRMVGRSVIGRSPGQKANRSVDQSAVGGRGARVRQHGNPASRHRRNKSRDGGARREGTIDETRREEMEIHDKKPVPPTSTTTTLGTVRNNNIHHNRREAAAMQNTTHNREIKHKKISNVARLRPTKASVTHIHTQLAGVDIDSTSSIANSHTPVVSLIRV